jgi:hypothetical protein
MYIKIENHSENTTRVTEYPGTLQTFIKVHFLFFGFYRIERNGKQYLIFDKFNNSHVYTISKATKGDMQK